MIVVSDTSPICYLLLINKIDILQVLYNVVTIPQTVADELSASESPSVITPSFCCRQRRLGWQGSSNSC